MLLMLVNMKKNPIKGDRAGLCSKIRKCRSYRWDEQNIHVSYLENKNRDKN